MKTATILVYQPHGTREWFAGVYYRGRCLRQFTRQDVLDWESLQRGVRDAALVWAEANGFTHYVIRG